MALTTCRECGAEVSDQARACPRCGASQPANPAWSSTGFEWKSSRTYGGYPLVHIAFGKDSRGKRRVAKGIVAIGQFALGLITVAQFGVGLLFGFGQFLIGGVVLAQFAGALVLGVGQIATGYVAIGQVVLAYYGLENRPGEIPLDHVATGRRSRAIFPVLVELSETAHKLAATTDKG